MKNKLREIVDKKIRVLQTILKEYKRRELNEDQLEQSMREISSNLGNYLSNNRMLDTQFILLLEIYLEAFREKANQ